MTWLHIPTSALPRESAGSTSELSSAQADALARSAMWRSKHRPPQYWQRAWQKEPCLKHLSGPTCTPSTAQRGVDSWMESLRATRASRSAQPGRRRGFDDPRNLWPAIERIIGECRPAWCFFENVAGHLRLVYFDHVRPRLEALGYRVSEQVVKASDVGATHRRERLFILAVADAERNGPDDSVGYPAGDRGQARDAPSEDRRWQSQPVGNRADASGGDMADAERRTSGQVDLQLGPHSGAEADRAETRGRLASPSASDELLARPFPPGPEAAREWRAVIEDAPLFAPAVEPTLRGVADGPPVGLGLTRAEQLRLLGNGVVPQQAALAWQLLWQSLL